MCRVHFVGLATLAMFVLGSAGCGGSDPTGSGGEGDVSITTWGEAYVEEGIPASAADGGFVDGWSLRYEKFLVNLRGVVVADSAGEIAAEMQGSKLFDNTLPGVKSVIDFSKVRARAWDGFGYEIAPVSAETELAPDVAETDKSLMIDGAYSLYVAGAATKGSIEKRFAWGFAMGTKYERCHSEQDGKDTLGIVVRNNSQQEVQLTTHGDHLFYDRLEASANPAVETALRFDAIAGADADANGEVTLEELNATLIDVRLYDPSGLPASTLGGFITSLARTVGHFRGEGECDTHLL